MASFCAVGNVVFFYQGLYIIFWHKYMKNDAKKKKLLNAPFKDEVSVGEGLY